MRNLLHSFYTLMKLRVGFFDLEGREILAFPPERTNFCNLIRGCSAGEEACCDRAAFQKATDLHSAYIYRCHTGLTEVIAPIVTSGEKRVGYLMIGQVRQTEQGERYWQDIRRKLQKICSDMKNLKAAYFRLTVIRMDEVRACANILQALANYVLLDHYIRLQHEPLSIQVKTYIEHNLENPLSLPGIAQEFGVGKTTLCNAIKRDFHQTVNELIRTTRIEQAKQFLQSGKQSIAEIAEATGIPDYNYFSKVFREEIGVPPSLYRKLCEGGYLYKQNNANR